MSVTHTGDCLLLWATNWGMVVFTPEEIPWEFHTARKPANISIPLLCSKAGKDSGSEQKQYKITSAIRRTLGVGYDDVTASFISQWCVFPCAGGSQFALCLRDSYLFPVCRPSARTSKKSLLSAPWNMCPTVALMAKPTATDVLSATPTCKYRSETFPFMISSRACCECRALS